MEILNDFNVSVQKSLEEIDPHYLDYPGIVICGTHSPHDVEEMIATIQKVRLTKTPFLGICFGHQLAAVEYARNVLGFKDATSEEFGLPVQEVVISSFGAGMIHPTSRNYVVTKLSQLKVGLHDGESYWNNYEVVPHFEDNWIKEENFITCQYHPEYQSSKDKPHPLLVKFLNHAKMAM